MRLSKRLQKNWSGIFILTLLLIYGSTGLAQKETGHARDFQFRVQFSKEVCKKPVDGRLLLMISNDDSREPRFQIRPGPNTQLIFGMDVNGLIPGQDVEMDGSVFGFPLSRIEKIPTESMEGYDLFLKGRDKMFSSSREDLAEAVTQFKGALLKDNNFALAYADLSITYSILDFYQAEKQYIDSAIYYADNALRIDPLLPQSLVSKALSFMNSANYGEALPYLEKALEYNPNSAFVINLLSDYYTSFEPNAEKYLEYALKGIELDIASNDSAETSVIYLHLSNAFIQSGFVEEAEHYINKSLDYDPDNIYSEYVRSFILYARDGDLSSTKERLKATFAKDTTRLDVLQEIAKICSYMRDYNVAYKYYNPFNQVRDALNLDIYKSENGKIAVVLDMVGRSSESERYFSEYKSYAEADKSIYRNLSLAMYYAYMGDSQKALEHMKLFAMEDNYHYWTVLFLKIDPLIDKLKDNQEFMRLLDGIEKKFWEYHNELKTSLEKKELI